MAVAEKHGKVDELVTHYASTHLESNVTSMILLGTASSSGQKPNWKKRQTRRKRPQKQLSVKKVSSFQLPCSSTSDTSKTISFPSYSHAVFHLMALPITLVHRGPPGCFLLTRVIL